MSLKSIGRNQQIEESNAANSKYIEQVLGNDIKIISDVISKNDSRYQCNIYDDNRGIVTVTNTPEHLTKLGFVESYHNGVWFLKALEKNQIFKKNILGFDLCYNTFKKVYKQPENSIKTNSILESKEYTFGVELEANSGYMPDYIIPKLNAHCERDGSINKNMRPHGGPEFVTGVLKGDQGFEELQTLCTEVSRRFKISKDCGIHVHIGGMNVTDEFIVLSYILALNIEKEIFNVLPVSRRQNEYCKLLPNLPRQEIEELEKAAFERDLKLYNLRISTLLDKIYDLALVQINREERDLYKGKTKNHPKGARCGYDRSTIRYCWLNFVPLMFNIRGNNVHTLEFRPHSASASYNKIKNWVLLCAAFVSTVENHNFNLIFNKNVKPEDLVKSEFKRKGNLLASYFEFRRKLFSPNTADASEKIEYSKIGNRNKKKITIKKAATCV